MPFDALDDVVLMWTSLISFKNQLDKSVLCKPFFDIKHSRKKQHFLLPLHRCHYLPDTDDNAHPFSLYAKTKPFTSAES